MRFIVGVLAWAGLFCVLSWVGIDALFALGIGFALVLIFALRGWIGMQLSKMKRLFIRLFLPTEIRMQTVGKILMEKAPEEFKRCAEADAALICAAPEEHAAYMSAKIALARADILQTNPTMFELELECMYALHAMERAAPAEYAEMMAANNALERVAPGARAALFSVWE